MVGAVVVLAIALAAAAPASPASAAAYDRFYANFAGEELMRAINADRQALGFAALATDATLEAIARDRSTTCPSNASLVIRGRARDMADRSYLSHTISGCDTSGGLAFTAFDLLAREGYSASGEGETIGSNTYPSSAKAYATGCSLSGGSCRGSTTLPWTVAVVERDFMSSSTHRATLLSTSYRRFGCGAWRSSGGTNYYACYVVGSGNGVLDGSGPGIGGLSGVGATIAGSSASFSATFADASSVLSDGWATVDGSRVADWAWDHVGASATVSVPARGLTTGSHTFTWWGRDASTRISSRSFQFSVTGGSATPSPTPKPTATPRSTPRPTPRPTATQEGSPPATAAPTATPTSAPSDGPRSSAGFPNATAMPASPGPDGSPAGGGSASAGSVAPTDERPGTAATPAPTDAGSAGPREDSAAVAATTVGLALGLVGRVAVLYVAGAIALGMVAGRRQRGG